MEFIRFIKRRILRKLMSKITDPEIDLKLEEIITRISSTKKGVDSREIRQSLSEIGISVPEREVFNYMKPYIKKGKIHYNRRSMQYFPNAL